MQRVLAFSASAAMAFAFAAPAYAQGNAAAAQGNVDEGRVKVYTCTGCHGIPGYKNAYPNYSVPKIHNQNYAYLVAALNAYKTGERSHPTMRAQGESMTEQDIADIAAYLSTPFAGHAEGAK